MEREYQSVKANKAETGKHFHHPHTFDGTEQAPKRALCVSGTVDNEYTIPQSSNIQYQGNETNVSMKFENLHSIGPSEQTYRKRGVQGIEEDANKKKKVEQSSLNNLNNRRIDEAVNDNEDSFTGEESDEEYEDVDFGRIIREGLATEDNNRNTFWFKRLDPMEGVGNTPYIKLFNECIHLPITKLANMIKVNKDFVIFENKDGGRQINAQLKNINNRFLEYVPNKQIDGKATQQFHVSMMDDNRKPEEYQDRIAEIIKDEIRKSGASGEIDINTKFLNNEIYQFALVIFEDENDAFRFSKFNGRNPIFDKETGLVIKPVDASIRCADQYKWTKMIIKDVSYDPETAVEITKDLVRYDQFADKLPLISHNRNPVTGTCSRNVTVIGRSRIIKRIVRGITENKPKGQGKRGACDTFITAEIVRNNSRRPTKENSSQNENLPKVE